MNDDFIAWMIANETMNGSVFLAPRKKVETSRCEEASESPSGCDWFLNCQSVRWPPTRLRWALLHVS